MASRASLCSDRFKSTAARDDDESAPKPSLSTQDAEMIRFPSADGEEVPVLLNAQEHAVGYLSKILNARVYDAARETELQQAKNLSTVGLWFNCCLEAPVRVLWFCFVGV